MTDERLNELLTIAASKTNVDVSTCPAPDLLKIPRFLGVLKTLKQKGVTAEEVRSVQDYIAEFQ